MDFLATTRAIRDLAGQGVLVAVHSGDGQFPAASLAGTLGQPKESMEPDGGKAIFFPIGEQHHRPAGVWLKSDDFVSAQLGAGQVSVWLSSHELTIEPQ